jgi:hypothetical protein
MAVFLLSRADLLHLGTNYSANSRAHQGGSDVYLDISCSVKNFTRAPEGI